MRAASDTLSTHPPSPTRPAARSSFGWRRGGDGQGALRPVRDERPAVSKHLRVLERAGLIQRGREAQWRPRTLDAGPLKEVAEWAGEFRRFWDASYARLDAYLERLKRQEKHDGHRH